MILFGLVAGSWSGWAMAKDLPWVLDAEGIAAARVAIAREAGKAQGGDGRAAGTIRTGRAEPANCAEIACPVERSFLIVFSDPGLDEHDLGRIFELSARTHEREIRANAFPGVPEFRSEDRAMTVHVGSVTELRAVLSLGNIAYLAYFGHSANEWMGALLIGEESAPDTNLTNAPGPNNTAVTTLSPPVFRSDAQIRLFGCRGAFGKDSVAEQMAAHLRVPVYGYANDGGSIGTVDPRLGHGGRVATRRDVAATISGNVRDLWLVPSEGRPVFRRY